jgi:hypothetical protein
MNYKLVPKNTADCNFYLFDFYELHGFVEVVEHILAFLCDLIGYVATQLFRSNQLLLHHGVENLR